jgi:hypothetical protein
MIGHRCTALASKGDEYEKNRKRKEYYLTESSFIHKATHWSGVSSTASP